MSDHKFISGVVHVHIRRVLFWGERGGHIQLKITYYTV